MVDKDEGDRTPSTMVIIEADRTPSTMVII